MRHSIQRNNHSMGSDSIETLGSIGLQWSLTPLKLGMLAATVMILAISLAHAASNSNPKILLESISTNMITALNENRAKIKTDHKLTQQLIEKNLLPHIDFINASKEVLGQHWDSATKQQKIGFIKAFRSLLLNFYSSALTEYLNSHDGLLDPNLMEFLDPGKITSKYVTVRSLVKSSSGKAVPINYEMTLTRKGWKIFDVSVEGVSVITTYKSSYAHDIDQKGLDELINTINTHNKKLKTAQK